jgi:hypothetical protein
LPYVCDGPGKQYILTNDIDIPYYDEKYQRVQASALTSMARADKKMVNKLVEAGNYLAVVSDLADCHCVEQYCLMLSGTGRRSQVHCSPRYVFDTFSAPKDPSSESRKRGG